MRYRHLWSSLLIGAGVLVALALSLAGRTAAAGLTIDDEITPTPTPTTIPFLQMPFAGTYQVNSYFDHQSPTYTWDDTIILFNGDQASAIDGVIDRGPTFRGGYWYPRTSWYVYYDGHNGIDYDTGAGTTILAAAPGKVVFADSVPSSCDSPLQYVCIEHQNEYRTFYLHLEGIAVRTGQWVEAGDPVGISGNSGCSLGPHLHFAVDHHRKYTDPYGWQPADRPDPLISYADVAATSLWLPEAPSLPVGAIVSPDAGTRTRDWLNLVFVPAPDSPPVSRVEFLARYRDEWHALGAGQKGTEGWSLAWDTRNVPEGVVWVHAWAIGTDGRVGKGSPIRDDITVDRQPPLGYLVGLEPGSTAGTRLWLYAASYDPASTTERVTLLARTSGSEVWQEIGEATWMHSSNWLFEWDLDAAASSPFAAGSRVDIAARLTDGAGNATLTEPVERIDIDPAMPVGQLIEPAPNTPLTGTVDLVYEPLGGAAVAEVAFYAWYDAGWHQVGTDVEGSDGWQIAWDPAQVDDQQRVRVQAQVYDAQGRMNTALPQVTGLVLDRTPPSAGYVRPRSGGVARPDVDQVVWAWDGGSGIERVEFYVNEGPGWLKIGEDRDATNGWRLSWDAKEVGDGVVQFSARVYDRAGNEVWTTDQTEVALDRVPPQGRYAFPNPGDSLGGTITVTLDVTDTLSGLDRAIFYARYDDQWHHLGADTEHEDGFAVAWDTTLAGEREDVALTAWVYDRAGNCAQLSEVEGLAIVSASDPGRARAPTPAPTGQPALASTSTPPPAATHSPTTAPPTMSPTTLPSATHTPRPLPTAIVDPDPTATGIPLPTETPTAPLSPAATPTVQSPEPATPAPLSPSSDPPVPPSFWLLIAAGGLVGTLLLIRSLRDLRSRSARFR